MQIGNQTLSAITNPCKNHGTNDGYHFANWNKFLSSRQQTQLCWQSICSGLQNETMFNKHTHTHTHTHAHTHKPPRCSAEEIISWQCAGPRPSRHNNNGCNMANTAGISCPSSSKTCCYHTRVLLVCVVSNLMPWDRCVHSAEHTFSVTAPFLLSYPFCCLQLSGAGVGGWGGEGWGGHLHSVMITPVQLELMDFHTHHARHLLILRILPLTHSKYITMTKLCQDALWAQYVT